MVLIYTQWTNSLFVEPVKEYYGWRTQVSSTIWPYLLHLHYLSFMGIGLYVTVHFMRYTRNPISKKQAKIIFVTVLIGLVLGTITDVILPRVMNIYAIPNIADFFVLILAFGVAYAMVKYKFLTITPVTAARNIISTMYDCLILLKMEGNIASVNKATLDLLGYKEKELKGVPVRKLFTAEEASLKAASLAGKFITFSTGGWLKKERVVLSNVLKEARRLEVPGRVDRNVEFLLRIAFLLLQCASNLLQIGCAMLQLIASPNPLSPAAKGSCNTPIGSVHLQNDLF
ncbi:MAG: PAS domain S-box protein [Candidatus Aminicenantes bacterium]|nr:PAS domain S-box protein [Candidatus Aminicenantes bacterium]NIN21905.1 PAS domain S-box protein [Candidatus Aminicenantes bacterium]NIN45683.1 PAS domain S-box protein [Candidatus Aminicenantes bacterium]NIN88518.1 PAS domain S-box protein [Candidatus Aminicenantes bacterium]NIO84967.1 PAS domain S-box protein [Candidatus Aminicenantes bacterium]